MTPDPKRTVDDVSQPETPFPKHRYVYLGLKVAVIVFAILVALRYFGVV